MLRLEVFEEFDSEAAEGLSVVGTEVERIAGVEHG
jgi:hypothetical protein